MTPTQVSRIVTVTTDEDGNRYLHVSFRHRRESYPLTSLQSTNDIEYRRDLQRPLRFFQLAKSVRKYRVTYYLDCYGPYRVQGSSVLGICPAIYSNRTGGVSRSRLLAPGYREMAQPARLSKGHRAEGNRS